MNEQAAWKELLDAVKSAVPQTTQNFRWFPPARLAFFRTWQVQARLVSEPNRYSIFFERVGAELGHFNYETIPYSGEPKQTVLTMLLDLTGDGAFWRLADGRTLKSDMLARWVVNRLPSFHDEYGRAVTGIGF